MVRGNTSRTASTLAAIAQGDAPPPELEVARTPRSGTSLTHRAAAPDERTQREHARLDRAPPAASAPTPSRCSISGRSSCSATAARFAARSSASTTRRARSSKRARCRSSELGHRTARRRLRRRSGEHHGAAGHDAQRDRAAGPLSREAQDRRLRSARHAAAAARAAGRSRRRRDRRCSTRSSRRARCAGCCGVARGADPEDLNPPERTGQGVIDLVELDARVVRAENALNAAHKGLQNLIARITTTTTAEMLRTALLKLGAFGVGPSVPVSVAGEDAERDKAALAQQGQALLKLSGPRLDQGAALRTEPVATDQRGRRAQLDRADARGVRRRRSSCCRVSRSMPPAATEFASALGGQHRGAGRRSAGGEHVVRAVLAGARWRRRGSAPACSARKCSAPARGST